MKMPFVVEIPDFSKEIQAEVCNAPHYNEMTAVEREDYVRRLVQHRSIVWACRTSASAYNLGILLVAVLILINGPEILHLVQRFLMKL